MDLHNLLYRLMSEYSSVLSSVKKNNDFKNPFRNLIAKEIPHKLTELTVMPPYSVVGSYGKGRWTDVPWIAIFDERITKSAQRGVYIVYLLNKNAKELYLTLEIAATEVMDPQIDSEGKPVFTGIVGVNSSDLMNKLSKRADHIRSLLKDGYFISDNKIKSGSPGYDHGAVYYKKYTLQNLPSETILINDLKKMMDLYGRYYSYLVSGAAVPDQSQTWLLTWNPHNWDWENLSEAIAESQKNGHWPDGWSCSNTHVKPGDRIYLIKLGTTDNGIIASGYAVSPSHEEPHWDPEKAAEGKKSRHIDVDFDWIIDSEKDPILLQQTLREKFPKQTWSPQSSGIRILEEYVVELEKLWQQTCRRGEHPLTVKEIIHEIKSYIASEGFSYEDGLIENFYLSLKSKPFVILAGTSGTGKTRLVKLFAEAMGAAFKLVPVRPDWSDGSDLFGHTDLNGQFIPGPVCEAFDAALNEPDKPVFLCLDEMNLARVEYYLSDFLSVIESRRRDSGHIVTESIAQYKRGVPENLYIIGTVNMDETTFPFSKKVLDRANTIEFYYVDLMPKAMTRESLEPQNLPNRFLRTEYLVLATDCNDETMLVEKICTELQAMNEKLVKANAHVGYRVRDEIVFYFLNNKNAGGLLTYEQAMDNEIMQKILPRVQGSSAAIKALLIDLFKLSMGNGSGIDADTHNVGELMKKTAASAKYPKSATKIGYMMTRFEDDGFTSYWL